MAKLFEQLRQLDRLDQLIRLKATGSPKSLAQRMQVSERTIYNLIDTLRAFGADICYCRNLESYYYAESINFRFDIVVSERRTAEMKGGNAFFSHCKKIADRKCIFGFSENIFFQQIFLKPFLSSILHGGIKMRRFNH